MIDSGVIVAVIGTATPGGMIAWYVRKMAGDVAAVRNRVEGADGIAERQVRISEKVDGIEQRTGRIEAKLDRFNGKAGIT